MRSIVLAAGLLAAAGPAWAAVPPFLHIDGTTSLLTLTSGGSSPIITQSVELGRWPGVSSTVTGLSMKGYMILPEVELAFGQMAFPVQEHPTGGTFTTTTREIVLDTILKVTDNVGNSVEVPAQLTTGELDTVFCEDGNASCFGGFPGDPNYCQGSPWDPNTGDVRLVAFVQVPGGTGTLFDTRCFLVEVDGTIAPGSADADTLPDFADNCPNLTNSTQSDTDADGVGNACDNCSAAPNTAQSDRDADGVGDLCDPFKVNFQQCADPIPSGYVADCGGPFQTGPGYGWLGTPSLQCRDRNINPDQRLDTFCFSNPVRRFELELEPGDYDVTVVTGDAQFAQGPHRVVAEGVVMIDNVSTAANVFTSATRRLYVRDGRLSIDIGGGGGNTMLNYVDVAWASQAQQPARLHAWNFQPQGAPVPRGFAAATGAPDDPNTRWGWGDVTQVMDRNLSTDQVLDTLSSSTAQTFEAEVANTCYVVSTCAGDYLQAQGPHNAVAEAEALLGPASTAAGQFVCNARVVKVKDGRLSVTVGDGVTSTTLNHVTAATTPLDFDLDAVSNCPDNCPNLYNPSQADNELDGLGDLCDPDDDNDTVSDVIDCAPTNGSFWAAPVEVTGLELTESSGTTLIWDSQAASSGSGIEYDVATGSLVALAASGTFADACAHMNLSVASWMDTRVPAVDEGFYYLVQAQTGGVCGSGGYGPPGLSPPACP